MSGQDSVLPILGVGPDGTIGTGDDTDTFVPGEQGQAEFLLEGRREGFHAISFDIEGSLEGLPIGPVPVKGQARGGVLVRNPFFNLTFTAPSTVRNGEEFSLFVTVTNISQAIANLVTITLNQAGLAGAQPVGDTSQQIDTLLAGDSETLRFRFISTQTGQVNASYLRLEGGQNQGELLFALGVGDRGVPLSPDTIVLPSTVEVLPEAVLMAALRVLGQAWSVATAPAGTLPQGVTSVSKGAVFARATDLAEAGFRVQIGEPIERALQTLAFLWVNTESTGFEQVIRETNAGEAFQKAVGESLSAPGFIDDFQRQVSQNFATQPSHILVGVGDGTGAAPINWQVSDGVGRTLQVGGESTLQNAAFIPLAEIDPVEPGRGLTLVTRLSSTLYEVRWVAAGDGALDLVLTLPRPEGVGLFVFSGVAVESGVQGKVELDLLRSTSTLTLGIDRDGDGIFEETVESAPAEILSSGGPELLAATAIGPETLNGADPWDGWWRFCSTVRCDRRRPSLPRATASRGTKFSPPSGSCPADSFFCS